MIANHTGIRTVFQTQYEQYKILRKKDAFLQQYRDTKVFENNLDELDDSAEVVNNLIQEYAAAEKPNYGQDDSEMGFEGGKF